MQEDIEHFGDVGSLDDNMDSFLSHDGGEGRDLSGTLKPGLTERKTESSKGFSFGEVGCVRTRNKVTCCHFSSDGKLLASAGHDKKVVLWSMDTLKTETTPEEHQYLITDPSYCLNAYTGHPNHVISLDFHPKKNDLFCFCDSNNEIRYWNINPFTCARVSKQGGSTQVRFQPISGHVLAAASNKVVSVFDVETDRQTHAFQVSNSKNSRKPNVIMPKLWGVYYIFLKPQGGVRKFLFGFTEATYSSYTCYTGIADFVPADIETVGYRVFLGRKQYFVSLDVGPGKMQRFCKKQRLLKIFEGWCDNVIDLIAISCYEDSRRLRIAVIHGLARMAAIMASTYEAYLGVGLGPLSFLTKFRIPHPGRVGGSFFIDLAMPLMLSWVLGGNGSFGAFHLSYRHR
ncbi:unnamed protein product [Camellia sinensis]